MDKVKQAEATRMPLKSTRWDAPVIVVFSSECSFAHPGRVLVCKKKVVQPIRPSGKTKVDAFRYSMLIKLVGGANLRVWLKSKFDRGGHSI